MNNSSSSLSKKPTTNSSFYNKTWTGIVNQNNNGADSTGSQSTAGFDSPKLGGVGDFPHQQQHEQSAILNPGGGEGDGPAWMRSFRFFGLRLKTVTALLMTSIGK